LLDVSWLAVSPNSPPVKINPEPQAVLSTPAASASTSASASCFSAATSDAESVWTVKPTELVLTVARQGKEQEGKMLEIYNSSDQTIQYQVSWPGSCLSVSPDMGTVSPRGKVQVSVKVVSDMVAVPWTGALYVCSSGTNKMVQVKVVESEMPSAAQVRRSAQNDQKSAPQKIKFPPTHIGKLIGISFNWHVESDTSHWWLSASSAAYLQRSSTAPRSRVSDSVFGATLTSSKNTNATSAIVFKFRPQEAGKYRQLWQFSPESSTAQPDSANRPLKFELCGQGIAVSQSESSVLSILVPWITQQQVLPETQRLTGLVLVLGHCGTSEACDAGVLHRRARY